MKLPSEANIPLTARRREQFTPPSLDIALNAGLSAEADPIVPHDRALKYVELKIPTPSERDMLNARIFELGMVLPTPELIRATMVDELFNLSWHDQALPPEWEKKKPRAEAFVGDEEGWSNAVTAFNADYAEHLADLMDEHWQKEEADGIAMETWQEMDAERIRDEAATGKSLEPLPLPVLRVRGRAKARVQLLLDDVTRRSRRIRKIGGAQQKAGALNDMMIVRIHLLAAVPAYPDAWPAEIALVADADGVLSHECVDDFREHIGAAAWREIVRHIDRHYRLSETERKNSVSPLSSGPDPTSSPTPSEGLESNGGAMTASSTIPTLNGGSETITARSSPTPSEPEVSTEKTGLTDEA